MTATPSISSTLEPGSSDCEHYRTKVIDSRKGSYRHTMVRRRRECLDCGERFSTVEISNLDFSSVRHHEFELWIERKITGARKKRTYGPA